MFMTPTALSDQPNEGQMEDCGYDSNMHTVLVTSHRCFDTLVRPLDLCRLSPARVAVAQVLLLLWGSHNPAQAQCAQPRPCATAPVDLGTLGGDWARVFSISSDGAVAVGMSALAGTIPGDYHAFRWSSAGMVDLNPMPKRMSSEAAGINGDGKVIVGSLQIALGAPRTTVWTSAGMSQFATKSDSYAVGASRDGSIIVGAANIGDPSDRVLHAYRWSSAGEGKDLGTFGGSYGHAAATSSDGSVIVGTATTSKGAYRAFRWTDAGMVDLGTLGGDIASATGVSADGTVVVGVSNNSNNSNTHAFLWTSAGMVDLGTLGGGSSAANGVSGDGSVVVGLSQIAGSSDYHAFRWTKATGMQDLNTLLSKIGIDMTGITLLEAVAISSNGEFIAGSATFPGKQSSRAFIVRFSD
jgi:probable HAF family extracellular repeat protein